MFRLIQKTRIWRTRVALKIGCGSRVQNSLHVNDRNVHVPPVRPHIAEKPYVAEKRTSNGRVRKRKQPKTHVPPRRFSTQQHCKTTLHHLKTTLDHRNSAEPLQ